MEKVVGRGGVGWESRGLRGGGDPLPTHTPLFSCKAHILFHSLPLHSG